MLSKNIMFKILGAIDAEGYREIRLECLRNFPDDFGTLFEDESKSESLKFDKYILSGDNSSFLMGAFLDNELIGICGHIKEIKPKSKHRGVLSHLYVKKDIQHKGIGKLLITETIKKAFDDAELELIELSVVKDNKAALKLYEDIGFERFGELGKYFKHGDKYWTIVFMYLDRQRFLR